MAKEKEIVIQVESGLTEDIFKEFFPDIHDEQNMVSRGEKSSFILMEEIPDPNAVIPDLNVILESAEWEKGWSKEALSLKEYRFNEDLTPFFKVDILDIENGKEEDKISLPIFVSFAKCKRKRGGWR